ncbi:MAG: hypothetical protein AB7O26_01940, partial [Planctomycetaceae bacterium]
MQAGARWPMILLGGSVVAFAAVLAAADGDSGKKAPPTDPKIALAEFNELVGSWRGIGQVRRGSTDGAWSEKAEWVWHFDKKHVGVNWE